MNTKNNIKLSIVIPAFNEEENIEVIYQELVEVLKDTEKYEIIFINDGSSDNTFQKIKDLSQKNSKIKYLSFSKNFGHQAALKAGLDFAKGDCVICLDADLQHPTELIPKMMQEWESGYDVVYTQRIDNGNVNWFKRVSAKLFYFLLRKMSDIPIEEGTADFRLLDRKVVNVIKDLNDPYLFLRGLVPWLGFKQKKITYNVQPRLSGQTKYTFKRMLIFAINGITGFSIKPLRIAIFIGLFFSFLSFLYMIYSIIIYFLDNKVVSGWASVVTLISLIGGIQLIVLGIIGEYVGKIYFQSKNRPFYIVSETNIDD